MKTTPLIAVFLIILGVMIFAYKGVTYTTRDKTMDFGPFQVSTEQKHTIPFAPIAGITVLIGGAVLLILSFKSK
jgi:uncharacterized membrane protein YidH (DUF202 family)